MKFILLVEGHTENKAVPQLLKRWLDPQLNTPVGIQPDRFEGWSELVKDLRDKTLKHLSSPKGDVIAVISLLDLYGPTFYPPEMKTADERWEWGRRDLEERVDHTKFRHYFAQHEVEAWLLSDPDIFQREVRDAIRDKVRHPETVNFKEPPAKLLSRLYSTHLHRDYKKVVNGKSLFQSLNPQVAYDNCPRLKEMLDEMLAMAQAAGL